MTRESKAQQRQSGHPGEAWEGRGLGTGGGNAVVSVLSQEAGRPRSNVLIRKGVHSDGLA